MHVAKEIIYELTRLYVSYHDAPDREKFVSDKRKAIKIIVDSLWEQLVENICGEKPRNYLQARRILNRRKSSLESKEDSRLVQSLLSLLAVYDVLIDKDYINIGEKLRPVFIGPLRNLCIQLVAGDDSIAGVKLRNSAERVGS